MFIVVKIIIKGDRNVGKTCLLERLQGQGFIETYVPSDQIQVASIQWSFKATEDVVKVEVWDVVDKGKAKVPQTKLKLNLSKDNSHSPAAAAEIPVLDAEFLDVYKGTHGVVMVMDITKAWTFEYIIRELPKIPSEIPVLILGNHCDMSHHRVITAGQAVGFIEQVQEIRKGEIVYGESSMRNGFGLRLLHKFLGLPFLRLQRETLLTQLDRNKRDMDICSFEVNEFIKSEDSDYNKFLDQLVNKRRQMADSNSNTKVVQCSPVTVTSSTGGRISSIPELRPTKSIIVGLGQPIVIPGQVNITQDPRLRNNGNTMPNSRAASKSPDVPQSKVSILQSKIASVDDFCPDGGGGLDKGFLDDVDSERASQNQQNVHDSDSEEDKDNPLVSRFHEEQLEEEDVVTFKDESPKPETKINPLAKSAKAPKTLIPDFHPVSVSHSNSSTDIDVAVEVEEDKDQDFDSWINNTTRRRSPEGGEDPITVASVHNLDTTVTTADKSDQDKASVAESEVKVKKHKKKKESKKDKSKDEDGTKKSKKKKKKKERRDSSEAASEETDKVRDHMNEKQSVEGIGSEYEVF